MIKAIVFDLDDTLYDEIEYCKSGFVAVARFLAGLSGWPPAEQIYQVLFRQFTSGNHTRVFNTAIETLGKDCDEEFITKLIKVYREHRPRITLPKDSRQVLQILNEKYTLALLTDGFLPAQRLKTEALGIEQYFKCIIYTEQLGRKFWKPSPAGFEKIIKELNVKAENTVYIADNEKKDFIAPNKLGFVTIQLIRPARIHTERSGQPQGPAQHVIHNLSELPGLLSTL